MLSVKLCIIGIFLYFGNTSGRELGSKHLPGIDVCGRQATDRIFGGEETDLREFPWMALLEYETRQGRKFFCGGALISKRYVLTAAHCIKDNLVSVRLGEHDVSTDQDCEDDTPGLEYCADPPKVVDIEEKITYQSYVKGDKNHHGDIALLRLKEDVTFNDFIIPICLPLSAELKDRAYAGANVTVAGWGKTENTTHSNVKLKVQLPVLSDSSCAAYYERYRVNLIGSQICAGGDKGKDSCNGDSGGPLMYLHRTIENENWVAIGVVSFGPNKCGSENIPAIYTRVPSYIDWILSNLKP